MTELQKSLDGMRGRFGFGFIKREKLCNQHCKVRTIAYKSQSDCHSAKY